MKLNKLIVVMCLFFASSCGPLSNWEGLDLVSLQPHILSVSPGPGETLDGQEIKLTFSQPILPESLTANAICVLSWTDEPKPDDLAEKIRTDDSSCLNGSYAVEQGTEDVVRFAIGEAKEGNYGILVTDKLESTNKVPFNQRPGETQTPFWSTFIVGSADGSEDNDGEASSENDQTNNDDNGGNNNDVGQTAPIIRPSWLVINELLYDINGDDMNGKVFIELYGDPLGNIGGYKINFVNGSDGKPYESIEIPKDKAIPEDGFFVIGDKITNSEDTAVINVDLIDNFDPQNGPDCVQLVDETGKLLDAMAYGTISITTATNGLACVEGNFGPDAGSDKSVTRTQGVDTNDNSVDFIIGDPTPGS